MDSNHPDFHLIILKAQMLSWDHVSHQLEVDLDIAEHKALISLVGCLASKKIQFKPAVHEAIQSVWKFTFELSIKDASLNTFLFHFGSPDHKVHVLDQSPWNIKGFLLILREWSPNATISSMEFSRASF